MMPTIRETVAEACQAAAHDPTRLMDVLDAVQARHHWISPEALELIARELDLPPVEVEGVAGFYAFYRLKQTGRALVRVCDSVSCTMHGGQGVAETFRAELGVEFGETTADGGITLERNACIGMCDQGPAAIINDVVFTHLSTDVIKEIVRALKNGGEPAALVRTFGTGQNANRLVRAMVNNNIRRRGQVIFAHFESGIALRNALAMHPAEVIQDLKTARLRGRGGAGFPTGMKWEFARQADAAQRVVICNADEGEPGTFKDRVLLTECADLVIEGMTIAGYAIGAEQGIIYLRGEYRYLRQYLENVLAERRAARLLGHDLCGKPGVAFDVQIKLGAGAYVCGEETALINSCEGLRGEPRDRPPFPAQAGYLGRPTIVNNVETLCCVGRILERGAAWFTQLGSGTSTGTKLFSVSGDCRQPGIYELPFGITVRELLAEVGGEDALGVQVGGPSSQCVGPAGFERRVDFDDLATGGSVIVFGPNRDVIEVAAEFMDFFVDESCGWCTPCRVGTVLIRERLQKILGGHGEPEDLPYLEELCHTVKATSRCGLGQTAPNPVLTTLKNFRPAYEKRLKKNLEHLQRGFDLTAALQDAVREQGRPSVHPGD